MRESVNLDLRCSQCRAQHLLQHGLYSFLLGVLHHRNTLPAIMAPVDTVRQGMAVSGTQQLAVALDFCSPTGICFSSVLQLQTGSLSKRIIYYLVCHRYSLSLGEYLLFLLLVSAALTAAASTDCAEIFFENHRTARRPRAFHFHT